MSKLEELEVYLNERITNTLNYIEEFKESKMPNSAMCSEAMKVAYESVLKQLHSLQSQEGEGEDKCKHCGETKFCTNNKCDY
jgi:hypothetical protein